MKKLGFYIAPSDFFINMCNSHIIRRRLPTVFKNIEESSQNSPFLNKFTHIFYDFDFKSSKLGNTEELQNKKLKELFRCIKNVKLDFTSTSIDILGDSYEFLMKMYSENSGKSGGEFFTPPEVSELLIHLGSLNTSPIRSVYDPSCGSGSLLLKSIKILGNTHISLYGQEINPITYNLCRMNMILHNMDLNNFNIACDDTLSHPHFLNKKFDLIVSNPPYSIPWVGDSDHSMKNDPRFVDVGVLPPKSKGDLAFVLHSLYYLKPHGTATIVCFPGVMYRMKKEYEIRKYLVENNFIDCIIQLPEKLFFSTDVSTCILILKKDKTTNDICFIDSYEECNKFGRKYLLEPKNIQNIVNWYKNRKFVENHCSVVSLNQIKSENFNLSVNTYVKQQDKDSIIDINQLNSEINEIVDREQKLRNEIDLIMLNSC